MHFVHRRGWDFSVSIAMTSGLDGRDSIPGRGKRFFFLLHSLRVGSEAQSASYQMGTGEFFSGSKVVDA
jgi:hypothetical protein